jgi:hypothetical protein
MEKYLEKIKPNVWEACTTDELFCISVDNPTNYDVVMWDHRILE